jgi:KDO2-lipid IV(A) lauroyltransferase
MYYLVYGFFFLLSLMPWWFIYLFSDGVYGLLYYVVGYRKKLVLANILIAFPEKSLVERQRIAKDFYHGFCDTFLESVKMLSISEAEVRKRMIVTGEQLIKQAEKEGRNVQLLGGHFMNWEYANHATALQFSIPCLGVYMPLSSKVFGRIMLKMRARFGTVLIAATHFKAKYTAYTQVQHGILLGADQKPGNISESFWVDFFGKPTPFVTGPEKGAKTNDAVVLFANYYRIKRGYYQCDYSMLTTTPQSELHGEIMIRFKNELEEAIRRNPSCYLWSHNRWKHGWKPEYAKLWIDKQPLPTSV